MHNHWMFRLYSFLDTRKHYFDKKKDSNDSDAIFLCTARLRENLMAIPNQLALIHRQTNANRSAFHSANRSQSLLPKKERES